MARGGEDLIGVVHAAMTNPAELIEVTMPTAEQRLAGQPTFALDARLLRGVIPQSDGETMLILEGRVIIARVDAGKVLAAWKGIMAEGTKGRRHEGTEEQHPGAADLAHAEGGFAGPNG